jgi:hypothetical protein
VKDGPRERPARHEERWAVAGCVALGLLPVLLFVPIVAILPDFIEARGGGVEKYAVGALKTLNSAQTLFREGDKDQDGTLDYGTLAELSDAMVVDSLLGSGVKMGYRFEVRVSGTSPEYLWMAVANPLPPRPPTLRERLRHPFARPERHRSFATNHSGLIFYALDAELVCSDACAIPSSCVQVGR